MDTSKAAPAVDTAVFAGGSFSSLEPVFETLPGVDSVVTGYTGGLGPLPDFESDSTANSSYAEAVRVFYHPQRIGYAKLLDVYWRNIDPTRADGQFSDHGAQFRTVVFYRNGPERAAALASRKRLEKSGRFSKPLVTEIAPAMAFHRAEARHQDYYRKNAIRFRSSLRFSGREAFREKVWGVKPAKPAKPGRSPDASAAALTGRRDRSALPIGRPRHDRPNASGDSAAVSRTPKAPVE